MADILPAPVRRLIGAPDAAARDAAWPAFVAAYTPILMHSIRGVARDRDHVMDAYSHVIESLRADDCRRLRAYREEGSARFTTWLAVVARRLAVDHHRSRYGRPRGSNGESDAAVRRRLLDHVTADLDPDDIADGRQPADEALVEGERHAALQDALMALSPADRLLLRLRFEDGVAVQDIARLQRFPTVFHVYRALRRALAAARVELERRGIPGAGA